MAGAMNKYMATVTIVLPLEIEAATKEEAQEIFEEQLAEIAGSNDGSELLANATPVLSVVEEATPATCPVFPY